ncbi:hypothetical protein ACFLZ5_03700 [Thermodesulfobacteriota bacterium]
MNKIIVVTRNPDTFTNPTLLYFFKEITRRGYPLIILSTEQYIQKPDKLHSLKTFQVLGYGIFSLTRGNVIKNIIRAFYYYWRVWRPVRTTRKKIIIGIDPNGLITAYRLTKFLGKPASFGYFSFEIFFKEELKTDNQHRLKKMERRASQFLDFCVVQDETREQLLIEENNINHKCFFFHIPVSPNKTSKLQLPPTKCQKPVKIVAAGTLDTFTGIDKLLDFIEKDWNINAHIEFHSRSKLDHDNPFKKRITYLKNKKYPVKLNDEPFINEDDYYAYLSKFDIGLALYFPHECDSIYTGNNIKYLGLSSGKFSTHMMLGMPTITTYNTTFADLNTKYSFGKCIKKIEELPKAIEEICLNYPYYQKNCIRLYSEILDPVKTFNKLLLFLENKIHG